MEVITKKTTDLTLAEKQALVRLFNDTFDKNRTVEEFENQSLNNCFGFSYHTLLIQDGEVIGSNSMVPSIYQVDGKQMEFVNSTDTMIDKHHRGLENFYDLIKESFSHAEKEGFEIVYGFPNDNSYPLFKGLKFMKDVGPLDTYCLPFRIGGVKPSLKFLNWASTLFCGCWLSLSGLFASTKVAEFRIEKNADSYNATRYKRMDNNYSIVHEDGLDFFYKIEDYEGIKAAFLIDVVQKSPKNFCKAAQYIRKHEKAGFDILLYVGHLPFANSGFVKVPLKYAPKKFNFTAGLLKKGAVDKDILFKMDYWDVNLSNYDLI